MPSQLTGFSDHEHPRTAWYWAMSALISVLLALKLHLIFLHNINWDEFLYLAKVYSALRGSLSSTLQTGYVHAFSWLPTIPGNEVDQIIAARGVMFVLQAGTCGFIYAVGRKLFGSPAAAVVGALVYLTFSYVIHHGASFRADPIAVFLLMAALWLLVRNRGGWPVVAAAGVLTALAGIVTIKSIFYAPTLGLAVLCLRGDAYTRQRVGEFVVFGVAALVGFLILYAAHRYSLDPVTAYSAVGTVARATDTMILLDQFLPAGRYLDISLSRDSLTWFLLLAGLVAVTGVALIRKSHRRGIGLVGLGLPLATLIFYRNAFPYYYVFVMAAPAVLAAGIVALAEERLRPAKGWYFGAVFVVLVALLSIGLTKHYARNNVDRTVAQRQIIDTIHRMFPQPVPYIDRCSMVPSFPKVGFFMSTWGMEDYLKFGQPVMRDLLRERRPLFLIANVHSLELDRTRSTRRHSLMAEDIDVLRDNFIPHWGAIWVAGKRLDLAVAGAEYRFEILVPGTYTVEARTPVVIDGVRRKPGTSIELGPGHHSALSHQASASVILRWGTDLYRPAHAPVSDPIFVSLVSF